MKHIFAALASFAMASTALADAPAGAASASCDLDAWSPVMSADGETVLYWNNATCTNPGANESARPSNVAADLLTGGNH